jgi:hypothetical protein
MTVTVAGLRAESRRLRARGWSYRRIALHWQRRYQLGARLSFRLAHGWTQEDAARRWNARWPGESPPKTGKNFSYWETWPARGGRAPSPQTLDRLAELYLCRPGDLLDGRDFGAFDSGLDAEPVADDDVGCACDADPEGVGSGLGRVPPALAEAARRRLASLFPPRTPATDLGSGMA